MPTILLTRPIKDSERLAARLRCDGYECLLAPMLKIVPTQQAAPDFSSVGAVMITSGNVFEVLQADDDPAVARLLALPCFCVGTQTSEKARSFGFQKIYDAAGEGRDLARLIGESPAVDKNKSLLHICARDVDSTASDELKQVGFKVNLWPIYTAEAVAAFPPDVTEAFYSGKINTVLFFSTRTAEIFQDLVIKNGLENACASIHAIGISQAVIEAVAELPWWTAVAAAEPTEDALLDSLRRV